MSTANDLAKAERRKRKYQEHESKPGFLRCGDERRRAAGKALFRDKCRYSCCSTSARPCKEQVEEAVEEKPAAAPPVGTLTISELKRRLALQGVDCSGCLEKHELIELLNQQPTLFCRPTAAPKQANVAPAVRHTWSHARQRAGVEHGFALADDWAPSDDLHGFVAMEKYDGIRASWEPCSKRFRTRSGGHITPPPSLAALLPKADRLDGELWAGRGKFEKTLPLVRTQNEAAWAQIAYVVFDAPAAGGSFSERLEHARSLLLGVPTERVLVAPTWPCEDATAKDELLRKVVAAHGEGLMLRRAASTFCAGRTSDMLRVKEWYDAEAIVVGSNRLRHGKDSLRVRCLTGEWPGVEFDVTWRRGQTEPPPGAVLTYKYCRGLRASPRFPGIRHVHPRDCACGPCLHWRRQQQELQQGH